MTPIDSRAWSEAAGVLRIPPRIRTPYGTSKNPAYDLARAKAAFRTMAGLARQYGRDPSFLSAQYPALAPARTAAPPAIQAPGGPVSPEEVARIRHSINSGTFNQIMGSPPMQDAMLRQRAKAIYKMLLHYDWAGQR
jgi:hypothetical protein